MTGWLLSLLLLALATAWALFPRSRDRAPSGVQVAVLFIAVWAAIAASGTLLARWVA